MLLDEKIESLQNLTKQKITYDKVAEVLGLGSKQAAYNRVSRKQHLKQWEENALDAAFLDNFVIKEQNMPLCRTLDYYPDIEVSCGNGIIPFGETKEKMTIPVSLIKGYSKNNKYIIVSATSDSMQPEIKPNDMLIIRVTDTDTIIDNHIYVFCYNERLYCKYLSYNVNQIIVRSANKDYPTRFIEKENINDFKLCGEVCGHFRSYNLK